MWGFWTSLIGAASGPRAAWAAWALGLLLVGVLGVGVFWLVSRSLRRWATGRGGGRGGASARTVDPWAEAGVRIGQDDDTKRAGPEPGGPGPRGPRWR